MDSIALILTALGTGAAAGGQAIANEAIKDAYTGLKTLIQRKFTSNPSAELALTGHETDPTTWEAPLKKALMQAQIDQDEDVIDAARKVMILVQPQQAAIGKYNVQITGNVQGYAQGDYQQVTINFGNDPKEK